MSKCLKCGKEVGDKELFCTSCGEKIYRCEKCGAIYLTGALFCEECGNKLAAKEVQNSQLGINMEQAVPATAEKKSGGTNKLVSALLAICVLGGGYYGYQQKIVIPREKAAAVQKAQAEKQALEQAKKQGVKQDVEKLLSKAKLKDEYDQRLTAAANAINDNKAQTVYTTLKELDEEISKAQKDVEAMEVSETCKTAQIQLKDLFYNEHLRTIGMLRGIRGETVGYSDGGKAYDKYHEIETQFQQEIGRLKAL